MIEVNIDLEGINKTYNLPSSWDEVTVEQFIKLYNYKSTSNELLSAVNLVSSISDIDPSILLQMDIDDFKILANQVKFLSTEVNRKDVDYLDLNGDKYYLYSDFNKLTTGEVITIETILDSANYDVHKVMADLLCLFLRKKDENGKYEKFSTDMLNRKDMFLKLPISEIYHVFGFFLDGRNISTSNTKDSTRNNDQSMTPKEDLQND